MKYLGTVGVALVAAAGISALAFSATSLYGQSRSERDRREEVFGKYRPGPNFLGARGSEIGITVRDLEDADLKREKLASSDGAVVESIRPEGPGGKAGLKAGDVVVEFDKERVRSARQLSRLVEETPAGRNVLLVVSRLGQRVTINVSPERAGIERFGPDIAMNMPPLEIPDFDLGVQMRPARLGVSTMELTDQLASYFGTKDGVLVTSVTTDSAGARAGLKAGDVITSVNGADIGGTNELRRELAKVNEGEASLSITRDRKPLTIKVVLERGSARVRRTV